MAIADDRDDQALEAALGKIGAQDDGSIDLAGAALLLAARERPRVSLGRYRRHLRVLGEGAAAAFGRARSDDLDAATGAVNEVLYAVHGYTGDSLTYDDLQNASLIRVIDRRRGLPVSLGILWIHTARALGLTATGINFPGHFLVRVDGGGERLLIDPFELGRTREAADLRGMARMVLGAGAELEPEFYAPLGNREVLLRLLNNIRFRHLKRDRLASAARTIGGMILVAPGEAGLWREAGLIQMRLGNREAAAGLLEGFLRLAGGGHPDSHEAAALLQELRDGPG